MILGTFPTARFADFHGCPQIYPDRIRHDPPHELLSYHPPAPHRRGQFGRGAEGESISGLNRFAPAYRKVGTGPVIEIRKQGIPFPIRSKPPSL